MKLYYSIREVADLLALNPSVIRYWEKEFLQLKPHKISNGERRYTEKEIDLLKRIHNLLKIQGYTIEGARKALNSEISSTVSIDRLTEIEQRLNQMKAALLRLKNSITDN